MTKKYNFRYEKDFSAWFRKRLEEEFGDQIVIINHTATGYGEAGISDLIICFFGFFVIAELKLDGKDLTALQDRFAMRVARAGGRLLMPVTPNPRKAPDGSEIGGADAAIDYLRQIANLIQMRRNVQTLSKEEAQYVVDETKKAMAREALEQEGGETVQ